MDEPHSQRYSRQVRLPQIGVSGQAKLAGSTVAIVGCGALGSVSAELLARAGVGHLILIDRDIVQESNLQRQLLYTEDDAAQGLAKADAAARHLSRINRHVHVTPRVVDLVSANILRELRDADLWIDGSDNFEVRYLINEAALQLEKTWVHGGCVATHGQVMLFQPNRTACFRCLVPEPPRVGAMETCDTAGVLGPATATVGSLQAAQALRFLVGQEAAVTGRMTVVDVWQGTFQDFDTGTLRGLDCPACVHRRFPFLEGANETLPVALCGQNAVQIPPMTGKNTLDLAGLAKGWVGTGDVKSNAFFARWSGSGLRVTVFSDGRALVEGTTDPAQARTIYHQLLGG